MVLHIENNVLCLDRFLIRVMWCGSLVVYLKR